MIHTYRFTLLLLMSLTLFGCGKKISLEEVLKEKATADIPAHFELVSIEITDQKEQGASGQKTINFSTTLTLKTNQDLLDRLTTYDVSISKQVAQVKTPAGSTVQYLAEGIWSSYKGDTQSFYISANKALLDNEFGVLFGDMIGDDIVISNSAEHKALLAEVENQ